MGEQSKPAWTPGPWKVFRASAANRPYQIDGIGASVTSWGGILRRSSAEGEANALLIAAAPELYAALAELRKWQAPCGSDPDIDAALRAADAALAKARGESP